MNLEEQLKRERARLRSVVEANALDCPGRSEAAHRHGEQGVHGHHRIGESKAIGMPFEQVIDCSLEHAVIGEWLGKNRRPAT